MSQWCVRRSSSAVVILASPKTLGRSPKARLVVTMMEVRSYMHVNKVHHVTTINRVAEQLGEDEDWLRDGASEMEMEGGVIGVDGVGEGGVLAFTDFGIESLIELIKMYQDDPMLLNRYDPQ